MNNNGKIKKLKPSHLIFDKNNTSYFGFDDTKNCIFSQDFEYLNNVDYITETINNKTFTVRATYKNTKIVCVGFLPYYILYKNCTDTQLSTIANNYYNTSLNEYSKDKMDINKAKDEYPTIHLQQEKAFFEYAQKNFFPLLLECDIEDLTIIYNEYVEFINSTFNEYNTKNVQNDLQLTNKSKNIDKLNTYNIEIVPLVYKYLINNDIDEDNFSFSEFCHCIETADFKILSNMKDMKNKTKYLIGFLYKFINNKEKNKIWYNNSAHSINTEIARCGNGAHVPEKWRLGIEKILNKYNLN